MVSQANRSSQAVSQALTGSGDGGAAADEFRTYMMMLLVSARGAQAEDRVRAAAAGPRSRDAAGRRR
jgi:hypothetical protein